MRRANEVTKVERTRQRGSTFHVFSQAFFRIKVLRSLRRDLSRGFAIAWPRNPQSPRSDFLRRIRGAFYE